MESNYRSWNEKGNQFYYFKDGRYYKDKAFKTCISERVCSEFKWFNADKGSGLKDRNDFEIYENDIVNVFDGVSLGENPIKVEFKNGGFGPFSISGWEGNATPENSEIIGNSHEKKDLLNATY